MLARSVASRRGVNRLTERMWHDMDPPCLYSTGDVVRTFTRDEELRAVEATLRRLHLTPEEAIKLVSKYLKEEQAVG